LSHGGRTPAESDTEALQTETLVYKKSISQVGIFTQDALNTQ
jgi:hypothetical protein